MNHPTTPSRRAALRIGAASLMAGVAACQTPPGAQTVSSPQAPPAPTPPPPTLPPATAAFPGFRAETITTDGVAIHALVGGSGPPLLLLHGAPQSSYMWRRIAPRLAEHFTVVAPDLRGYGRSDKPATGDYSKRRMAADQIAVMRALGFERFRVAAHDRGGHVARRMAKDHPGAVERLAILDIAPSSYIYANTNRQVATALWHWYFFSQPAPLPEALMGPQAATLVALSARLSGDPASGPVYAATNGTPAAFHAMCEDYRAGAGIDFEHDTADADRLIACPTLVIWGRKSFMGVFDIPAVWSREASDVRFTSLDAGHFLAEEKPEETLAALLPFLQG